MKITAPAAVPGKVTGVGGLVFEDGVAETDDPAIINYCISAGYGVGEQTGRPLDESEIAAVRTRARAEGADVPSDEELREQLSKMDPAVVRAALADPLDPRDLEDTAVGTRLRDATVDPHPDDFLPPTNAGEENPHGPLVVAPQIHASENQVVRPGEVFVEDLQAQQKAETDQAVKLLVKNEDVGEALSEFTPESDTGPIGLSDPGSVHAIKTGNSADTETATAPDGTPDGPDLLKGKELDAALDAAGLSKTGTADEKRARLAEHASA